MSRDAEPTFVELLEAELPPTFAVDGDATGYQIRFASGPYRRVGVCYEVDDAVVRAAIEEQIDLVIAFHPLIYGHLASLSPSKRVPRVVGSLLTHTIDLFVVHTRFDTHREGTNVLLARELGLTGTTPLVEVSDPAAFGMGLIGSTPNSTTYSSFVELVARVTRASSTRSTASDYDRPISTVALLGGSGMSYYPQAVAADVDAFVTGDVKYHDFHSSRDAIPIIDPGHDASERFVSAGLRTLLAALAERLPNGPSIIDLDVSTCPYHTAL